MITVKLTYEEKDSIVVKGIFLEGSENKIYKNASIDDKIFFIYIKMEE